MSEDWLNYNWWTMQFIKYKNTVKTHLHISSNYLNITD